MRTIAVAVVFSGILFLGLFSSFAQTNASRQQQIESHTRKAAEYLKENRPDLAIPEFKAILAIDPKNVDAHGNLGAVLFFQGAYAEAIPELRAALKLRPTLWKTEALLGIGEKRTGDVEAAQRDLEKAFPNVTEEKVRVETGMELIEIYSATGDLEKAAATVGTLRKLEPANGAILFAAYRIYSDLADESLLSLSVVDPNSARMHQALAHELAKRGRGAEAIRNYRAALKLDPQLPGIHFELAEMLNTLGTDEGRQEAESEYRAALAANPLDEQTECRLGEIAFRAGDLKAASDDYEQALKLRPEDPEANIGLAKVLMSLNEPQKAEPLLQRAIQLDPTSAVAHFRLSTIYRQTGRVQDAKHELEEYQKYKDMKEKLRAVYGDLHRDQSGDENDDGSPKK
ncbi:MAG: tetratricopeptide repeat protein [Terriglobales bacterium]